jgi:ferredoxin
MRITIDENACQGTGYCARIAPQLFVLKTDVVEVVCDFVPPSWRELARESEVLCPARAIIIVE